MFQFVATPPLEFADVSANLWTSFGLILAIFLLIVGLFFLVRSLARTVFKTHKAFERVVLQIQVPKEKRSEGTQQGNVDDRLEQIKEEIGLTETIFSTLASLKPEHGISAWFRGRNDHTAFEMVAHNNLIYFYIAVSHRWRTFIEQQIHAQYPYAHIEEMADYNIFSPN